MNGQKAIRSRKRNRITAPQNRSLIKVRKKSEKNQQNKRFSFRILAYIERGHRSII